MSGRHNDWQMLQQLLLGWFHNFNYSFRLEHFLLQSHNCFMVTFKIELCNVLPVSLAPEMLRLLHPFPQKLNKQNLQANGWFELSFPSFREAMAYDSRALTRLLSLLLSAVPTKSILIRDIILFGNGLSVGDAGNLSELTVNQIRGSIPDFLSRFTFVAFSMFGYGHKEAEISNQGFPSRTTFLVL